MAAANGRQILASDAVAALVHGSVQLRDLGEHQLRDLSSTAHLFQVGEGEFSSIHTIDLRRTNLRLAKTAFVGREAELRDIAELLRAGRLVTLTGVGGVGKTRLATQIGADLMSEFPAGVWLVELAEVETPDRVGHALCAGIGIGIGIGIEGYQGSALDAVVTRLDRSEALVIIDNCEHVLDAAAEVIEFVLDSTTGPSILATSREGLGVAGEVQRTVPSLDPSGDAMDLFVNRAAAVGREWSANADVAQLCARLDGIPLAIELDAAHSKTMTPAELLVRLAERFRLLGGGSRRLKRHQTMKATIDWSHNMLSDDERTLLRRMAAFAGTFDMAAGSAVADFEPDEHLAALVDKSLVETRVVGPMTRYYLLETIREYCREKLYEAEESDTTQLAHAEHFASLAKELAAVYARLRSRAT